MVRRQRSIFAAITSAWVGLLLACGGASTSSSKSKQDAKQADTEPAPSSAVTEKKDPNSPPSTEKKWRYQFVATRTEQTEHQNMMDLYAFDGDFDADDLKAFCCARKEKTSAKFFYFVVIFDKVSNAQFPSRPVVFEYADDESMLGHIRAIYCYNRFNGFSELRYHPQNIMSRGTTRVRI